MIVLIKSARINKRAYALLRKVRVDRSCTVTEQCCKMMNGARLGAFENNRNGGSLFCANHILLNGGNRKQGRNRDMVLIYSSVGKNDYVRALFICAVALNKKSVNSLFKRCIYIIKKRYCRNAEPGFVHAANLHQVNGSEYRVIDFKNAAVIGFFIKQVTVRADIYGSICHYLLTERIYRRICYLCEKLLEIIEKQLMFFGKNRKRNITAHGCCRFDAVFSHRQNFFVQILIGISENLIKSCSLIVGILLNLFVRNGKFRKVDKVHIEPFAVRLF